MVRRIIGIIILLAVLVIAGNDGWRYVTAQQALRDTTYDLATWAATNASTMTRNAAATTLASMAQTRGVRVYQYGQNEQGIQVWTEAPVTKTIAVATIVNLAKGRPFAEARKEPLMIRDYREAGYR